MSMIEYKQVEWFHCPRCIKGKMYKEADDEYVCLQCGFHMLVTGDQTAEPT